jgi:hypothetical protein
MMEDMQSSLGRYLAVSNGKMILDGELYMGREAIRDSLGPRMYTIRQVGKRIEVRDTHDELLGYFSRRDKECTRHVCRQGGGSCATL